MRTARTLTTVAAVLGALVLSASAQAKTLTQRASAPLAGGGTVTATLSYTPKSYYDAALKLTITRASRTLLNRAATNPACGRYCEVQDDRSVHVADILGDGEPTVFIDLYTGGAHCCSVTNFYSYDAGTNRYSLHQHEWGDPGYRLERVGGRYVFATADDRFADAFTDFAASGLPLALDSFDGTHLINITRQYPKAIATDAAEWLKAFKSQASERYGDTTGVIAAWAADEDELGNSAQVATYLDAQAADGHLNTMLPGEPENATFVTKLDAFLRKTGYLS